MAPPLPSTIPSTSSRRRRQFLIWNTLCFILLLALMLLNRLVAFMRNTPISIVSSKANGPYVKNKQQKEHGNDSNDLFYKTTWPPLQRTLCGKGYPNLMFAPILFELAREEAFRNNNSSVTATNSKAHDGESSIISTIPKPSLTNRPLLTDDRSPSRTKIKFFAGDWGASIFHGTNHQGAKFAILYVKIWKSGTNQVSWMEKKLFKHYNLTYVAKDRRLSGAIRNYINAGRSNITDGTYNYKFADTPTPCIYTAVRDPISHFLSGYNEIEVRQLGEYNNESYIDFPQNATRAPYHAEVPYSSTNPQLRKKRFMAFIRDVLLEEEVLSSHHVYSHFYSMSRVLVVLTNLNLTLTSYIPTLSNITITWPAFVSSTCPGAPPLDEFPHMTKQGQHRSSKDRLGLYKAAKDVWEEGGPVARSLCLLHAFDYACYEDLPEGVPPLCRKVYQDYGERVLDYGSTDYYRSASSP